MRCLNRGYSSTVIRSLTAARADDTIPARIFFDFTRDICQKNNSDADEGLLDFVLAPRLALVCKEHFSAT